MTSIQCPQQLRVALTYKDTLLDERSFSLDTLSTLRVGPEHDADFVAPIEALSGLPPMFSRRGGEVFVALPAEVHAKLQRSAEGLERAAGQAEALERALEVGDWGLLDFGDTHLFFQLVPRELAPPRRAMFGPAATPLIAAVAIALVAHAVFLLCAELSWEPQPEASQLAMADQFLHFIAQAPIDPLDEEESVPDNTEELSAKAAGGEEGSTGEENADRPESVIPDHRGPLVDKLPKDVGIVAALGSQQLGRGPLKQIFGDSQGFANQLDAAMNGQGDELALGRGNNGLGMRGLGRGGPGEGLGRVRGLGKVDVGSGNNVHAAIGRKKKAVRKTLVRYLPPTTNAFCDKANIKSVVQRGNGAVRYCFESELSQNPTLNGKTLVNWTIGNDGRVIKAFIQSSTVDNKRMESCLLRAVKRWRFEAPKGGYCQIAFPFTFKTGAP